MNAVESSQRKARISIGWRRVIDSFRWIPPHGRLPELLPRYGEFGDEGMSTAEYAIGTIAAAAFAAVLYTVVTGDSVVHGLSALVQRALSVKF
ncbi:MAG: DUF4244 domain-containing protein [Sciscionella sp.]|nr:DUF4244 domain-containing protein [Sciscionella sp.]